MDNQPSESPILIAQASGEQTVLTNQTPSDPNATDGNTSYELGMKFRSTQPGQILAIRHFKAASETGTHIGRIWTTTGTLLANVTFDNESSSGWQQQALNQPLNIQADTTYIVSVNCNSHFPITVQGLANPISNGDLRSIADGQNGVFGSPSSLPTNSYQNSNYYRDIVFTPGNVPTITKVSGDNQTGEAGTTLPNPLVVLVRDNVGNPISGKTVTFAVTAGGGSMSATSVSTNAEGKASSVLTLGAAPGAIDPVTNTVTVTASEIGSVTFTATANPPAGVTGQKILTNQAPSDPNATDGVSYELGMKFRSAKAGQIVAIRYLKSANETGSHIGKIWSATGTLLASVTFNNESASGWQQQLLAEPLSILSNTTYTVSVNCNSHFAFAPNQLATSIVNGDLRSVADGNNGVFGNLNSFPLNSFKNSNYFRDLVFVAGSAINKISGDNQVGQVGSTLSSPLVVEVTNNAGNPQSGVTVSFNISNGGGSVSPPSVTTNSNGQASTELTLGSVPSGPNNAVIATATAAGIGNVSFTAKAIPENANPIYIENQKAGTIDWQITNYTTASTNSPETSNAAEIAGYATSTSVNKGGSLPIKVSMATPGNYQLEVFRLGYYNGLGARLVMPAVQLNGITQPLCTFDPETRLVECSNWSTSYTIQTGSDWVSGLYVAKLTELAGGKQTHIWFVVRDDNSTSDIVFQSSFTTYQAYNNYGGTSLYGWNSMEGTRGYKVSFDRPFAQTGNGAWFYDKMTRFEPNLVRWLESQGYDVSYITNLDIQNNPQTLLKHKIFLSVAHDEYWSMEQRDAVEAARDANRPVNLAFFSANTAYWRVRFEPSSTGVPNRIMTCYKNNSDPVAPTNKFRLIGRPENALLGVMYIGDNTFTYNTSSNINNPSYGGFDFVVSDASDPYFANTGLANGNKLSMLVGFEWDAVIDNGQSPAGLKILSTSAVNPNPDTLDRDVPANTNYQISHAVRYTAASGAKVFSVGSIHWMLGLDSANSSTNLVDRRAKQIAFNVLRDMGAVPQTPDADIIIT